MGIVSKAVFVLNVVHFNKDEDYHSGELPSGKAARPPLSPRLRIG